MSLTSHATVTTERASRYLKQLCKHFDHKADSTFDDHKGQTVFEFGVCDFQALDGELVLDLTASDSEKMDRLEFVVGDHLERFGKKDELSVDWKRG